MWVLAPCQGSRSRPIEAAAGPAERHLGAGAAEESAKGRSEVRRKIKTRAETVNGNKIEDPR